MLCPKFYYIYQYGPFEMEPTDNLGTRKKFKSIAVLIRRRT